MKENQSKNERGKQKNIDQERERIGKERTGDCEI